MFRQALKSYEDLSDEYGWRGVRLGLPETVRLVDETMDLLLENEPVRGGNCCDPGFRELLTDDRYQALETHPHSAYGVWPSFQLAYFNAAWRQFASVNDGEPTVSQSWGLGVSVLSAVPTVLLSHFESLVRDCLNLPADALHPVGHLYECSSPTHYRQFRMDLYPLHRDQGLYLVHSLVMERRHDRLAVEADDEHYRDDNGLIHQCCHCRRVQSQRVRDRWDWIPQWVQRHPERTSHGLCPICMAHYYEA